MSGIRQASSSPLLRASVAAEISTGTQFTSLTSMPSLIKNLITILWSGLPIPFGRPIFLPTRSLVDWIGESSGTKSDWQPV